MQGRVVQLESDSDDDEETEFGHKECWIIQQ